MTLSAIDKTLAEVCWEKAILHAEVVYPEVDEMSRRIGMGATFLIACEARALFARLGSGLAAKSIWVASSEGHRGPEFSLAPSKSEQVEAMRRYDGGPKLGDGDVQYTLGRVITH